MARPQSEVGAAHIAGFLMGYNDTFSFGIKGVTMHNHGYPPAAPC